MNQSNTAIGFDARPLYRNRDGIGTFTEQTILAAAKQYPETLFIGVIFKGDNKSACLVKNFPKNISITILPFSWKVYRAVSETGVWLTIDKYINAKLTGFVYFNFVALPWVSKKIPKNLMVHDATFLKYPETVSPKNLSYLNKFVRKSLAKNNVQGFTLSNHSANLLSESLGYEFMVASPGPSPLNLGIGKSSPDGSLLFIGTLEPRKNLANLIAAYSELEPKIQTQHPLIVAGRSGWGNDDISKIIDQNNNIMRVDSPTDEQLSALYQKASCLIMPSTFEGFGIPALDASRFGIPVITSENSPMQEILGTNGAIYVDPTKISSIFEGLYTFTNTDSSKLQELTKNSQRNSKRYTWDAAAMVLFGNMFNK